MREIKGYVVVRTEHDDRAIERNVQSLEDVSIFRVFADGRRDRVPLTVDADPLAALEAAERRLLEAGGWVLAEPDVYGTERWSHPTWQGGRSEGRQVALTIERRRAAAKGGA